MLEFCPAEIGLKWNVMYVRDQREDLGSSLEPPTRGCWGEPEKRDRNISKSGEIWRWKSRDRTLDVSLCCLLSEHQTYHKTKGQLLRRGFVLKVYKRSNTSTMTEDKSSHREDSDADVKGQQRVRARLNVSPPTELTLWVFPLRWTGWPLCPACRHLRGSVTAYQSSRTTKTPQQHVVMVPLQRTPQSARVSHQVTTSRC